VIDINYTLRTDGGDVLDEEISQTEHVSRVGELQGVEEHGPLASLPISGVLRRRRGPRASPVGRATAGPRW
jgi:hypothetical protein